MSVKKDLSQIFGNIYYLTICALGIVILVCFMILSLFFTKTYPTGISSSDGASHLSVLCMAISFVCLILILVIAYKLRKYTIKSFLYWTVLDPSFLRNNKYCFHWRPLTCRSNRMYQLGRICNKWSND